MSDPVRPDYVFAAGEQAPPPPPTLPPGLRLPPPPPSPATLNAYTQARKKAMNGLIGSTVFLMVPNGIAFWDTSGNSAAFCLHFYLWCALIVGWGLFFWSKNHVVTKAKAMKVMIWGPIGLFLLLALLIIHFSGTSQD